MADHSALRVFCCCFLQAMCRLRLLVWLHVWFGYMFFFPAFLMWKERFWSTVLLFKWGVWKMYEEQIMEHVIWNMQLIWTTSPRILKPLKALFTVSEKLVYILEFSNLIMGNSSSVSKIRLRIKMPLLPNYITECYCSYCR